LGGEIFSMSYKKWEGKTTLDTAAKLDGASRILKAVCAACDKKIMYSSMYQKTIITSAI
jgi:hypothetical protein